MWLSEPYPKNETEYRRIEILPNAPFISVKIDCAGEFCAHAQHICAGTSMEEAGDLISLRVSEIQSNVSTLFSPYYLLKSGLLSQLTGGTCKDEERIGLLAERILQIVESLPSHLSNSTLSGQLHVAAVTLWNKVVFEKSDASLSLSLNAQCNMYMYMYN